jgi:hypothetical protein
MLYTAAETLIDHNAPPQEVVALLAGPLTEIAAGNIEHLAVKHALGFSSLYLEVQGDQGVVLHLWHRTHDEDHPQPTVSPIHQHSWYMKSRVLKGEIIDTRFDVRFLPRRRSNHRVLNAVSRGVVDEMVVTDKYANSWRSGTRIIQENEAYTMDIGPFHESSWIDEALTLVLASNDPAATNFTLSAIHEPESWRSNYNVERTVYSHEGTRKLAVRIASMLGIPLPATSS